MVPGGASRFDCSWFEGGAQRAWWSLRDLARHTLLEQGRGATKRCRAWRIVQERGCMVQCSPQVRCSAIDKGPPLHHGGAAGGPGIPTAAGGAQWPSMDICVVGDHSRLGGHLGPHGWFGQGSTRLLVVGVSGGEFGLVGSLVRPRRLLGQGVVHRHELARRVGQT